MADSLELSIVVPTFCERTNVAELTARLIACLGALRWELIFVDDDSPDATADAVRELARTDLRVRCVQRVGRRGLSTACVDGMLASSAPVIAVMDADLQHDETRLPLMLSEVRGGAELVIGTRYAGGGGIGEWDRSRAAMSRLATRLSRLICKASVSDPMSGFFMLRRELLHDVVHRLSGLGFKILLDIMASSARPLVVREVPYTFRSRYSGVSKLDASVVWDFGMLLADKALGPYVPVRFVAFGLVGGAGVLVHIGALALLLHGDVPFAYSQAGAALCAMLFNYSANNQITFRDRRRRGRQWVAGLVSFVATCSLGAGANVGVASYLFDSHGRWFVAALAGILVGSVWNYAVTSSYTWRSGPGR